MKIDLFLAWYDFWVGFYYDRKNRTLYFCPLPCVVLSIEFRDSAPTEQVIAPQPVSMMKENENGNSNES